MTATLMDTVTRAAHKAAARIFPFPCSIDGQDVDAVLLDPWESDSEFVPGRRTDSTTASISVLKADFDGRPKVGTQFVGGQKKGSVRSVSEGASHWTLGLLASLTK